MIIYSFPGIQVSTAGLATELEQQAQTTELQGINTELNTQTTALNDLNTELDAQTALLTTVDADTGNIATSTASIDSKTPALGQALAAASVPVVLTAAQVSTLTPQTDALTDTQLRASALPVSAASLPLPTGAATESTLSTLSGKVPANLTVTSNRLVVDGSGVTQPVSGTVTANAGSGTFATSATQSGTWTVQPGNTANTTAWLVSQNGRSSANTPVVNDYSSTPVTSAAYVQLVASTTSTTSRIEIFDSSGVALYLATGASSSETNQLIIFPGGNGPVDFAIPAGTRVSIKAVSTSATAGNICVNFYT